MDDYVVDLPPEYCQYHDAGCEFAQSCLNCHLPICIYDEPGGKQKLLKRRRAKEMARLFTGEGKSIRELAQVFGVSTRTIQRSLKVAFGDDSEKSLRNKNPETNPPSSPLVKGRGEVKECSSER